MLMPAAGTLALALALTLALALGPMPSPVSPLALHPCTLALPVGCTLTLSTGCILALSVGHSLALSVGHSLTLSTGCSLTGLYCLQVAHDTPHTLILSTSLFFFFFLNRIYLMPSATTGYVQSTD